MIDSLQLGDKYKITTPANWKKGDKVGAFLIGEKRAEKLIPMPQVIVHPSVQGEKVKELFGDNVETVYVSVALQPRTDPALTSLAIPPIHP